MLIIREATIADHPSLKVMIKKWISSQKLDLDSSEPTNFDVLDNCGSGSAPLYHCVVAENDDDNRLVGYALCTYSYMIFLGKGIMLENIFVEEEYRRQGVGKRLLAAICQHGLDRGCTSLEHLNTRGHESFGFFEKIGSEDVTADSGWSCYSMKELHIRTTAQRE